MFRIMPIGFMMALCMQTGNAAYLYLTVAFVQVRASQLVLLACMMHMWQEILMYLNLFFQTLLEHLNSFLGSYPPKWLIDLRMRERDTYIHQA
jgi:hypothetical protein